MGTELATHGPAAADQVEDPGRQVGLGHQAGEFMGIDRGFLAGFDHDGVAGDQRRCQLAGDEKEGEVPGQDAGYHAQWLAQQKDLLVGPVAGDDLAFYAPRPLGHVVEIVGGEIDLHFGQATDLALFTDDCLGQPRCTLTQLCRDAPQIAGALDGWLARPGLLGTAGGGDGLIDVFATGRRHPGQGLAGGRVMDEKVLGGRQETAIDVVLVDGQVGHGELRVSRCERAPGARRGGDSGPGWPAPPGGTG